MRRAAYVTVVLAGLALAGCTTSREITLNSMPDGAQVTVTADQKGPKDFPVGETPVRHSFLFGNTAEHGPTLYNAKFSKEGYETKTVSIDAGGARETITVRLEKEKVKEVPRHVLVVSGDQGYTIETRKVRAWVEDIEREGMAASSVVRLGKNQSVVGLTLAPDGEMLYFALAERIRDAKGRKKVMANLRAVRTTGGGITKVTSGQWLDANPACSADGKYIYFNSNRFQTNKPDIFRISTEKTGGIAVIRQTAEGANYQPSIGGNGLMAYTYLPKYHGGLEGERQIWSIGGDNQYPTQLRVGTMPAVSPDGAKIAFIGSDNQLWVMPVSGQNPVQLTSGDVKVKGKKNPSWSPDGEYIVFSSDRGRDSRDVANYDIWIIRADGTGLRQLTTNGSEDDYPVVSPDGTFIYFVSNRGFKEGIWRIPFPKSQQ